MRRFVISLFMKFVCRQATVKPGTRDKHRVFILSIISQTEVISYLWVLFYQPSDNGPPFINKEVRSISNYNF